jgi:hypothetical protein
VTIAVPSELVWTNPAGSENNFIIGNKPGDEYQMDVNSLKESSGHTHVDPGTYHDLEVNATGKWTLRFTPSE